jgi:hypothetical protein
MSLTPFLYREGSTYAHRMMDDGRVAHLYEGKGPQRVKGGSLLSFTNARLPLASSGMCREQILA